MHRAALQVTYWQESRQLLNQGNGELVPSIRYLAQLGNHLPSQYEHLCQLKHLNKRAMLIQEFYLHLCASLQYFHGEVQRHPLIEHRNDVVLKFVLRPREQLQKLPVINHLRIHHYLILF